MTKPLALYNEIDPFAAAWLRELIEADQIAPGVVVECSIEDITPNDLARWLMGLPPEWNVCAVMAMVSLPKKRSRSLKP